MRAAILCLIVALVASTACNQGLPLARQAAGPEPPAGLTPGDCAPGGECPDDPSPPSGSDDVDPGPVDPGSTDPGLIVPGAVSAFTFPSTVLGEQHTVNIWLPSGYAGGEDPYPVFVWMHGSQGGGFDDFWGALSSQGVQALAIEPVGTFGGVPSLWVDWRDESILASSLLLETISAVKSSYNVRADRGGWGVVGFSMGGFGAAHHAFKFPEMFGTIVPMAGAFLTFDTNDGRLIAALAKGPVFGDEAWFETIDPFVLLDSAAASLSGRTRMLVAYGDNDRASTQERSAELFDKLNDLGVQSELIVVPGVGHSSRGLFGHQEVAEWFRDAFQPEGTQ